MSHKEKAEIKKTLKQLNSLLLNIRYHSTPNAMTDEQRMEVIKSETDSGLKSVLDLDNKLMLM